MVALSQLTRPSTRATWMVGPWWEPRAQEMKQLGPGCTALLPERSWSSQPDPLQAERGYGRRGAGDASPGLAVQAA